MNATAIVWSFDLTVAVPTYHEHRTTVVSANDQIGKAACGRVLTYLGLPELNAYPIRYRHARAIGRPCNGCIRAGGLR